MQVSLRMDGQDLAPGAVCAVLSDRQGVYAVLDSSVAIVTAKSSTPN